MHQNNRDSHAHRAGKHGPSIAVSIFAVILTGFFLLRADSLTALTGTKIIEDFQSGGSAVMLEQSGDLVVAAFSGDDSSAVLLLNADSGKPAAQLDLDIPLSWAAVRDEKLFIREDRSGSVTLAEYNTETLTLTDNYQLGVNPDSIIHFDCDENGRCYYVLANERAVLHSASAAGDGESYNFSDRIEFFECTTSGTLWVYSGERLYRADPNSEFAKVEFSGVPYHLPDDDFIIDTDGVLYSTSSAQPEPLFRCGDTLYNRLSFCVDSEGCLVVSKTGGSVSKYSTSGEAAGRCKLEKTAMAVCGYGAVYRKGKAVYYAPFKFGSAEASPSPSPTPAPTEAPSTSTVPAYAEGDYIIVPMGTTVDELRELFKPEAVIIRSKNGEKAFHGKISTGMTAGKWILVVEGDCNGTGTVNIADIKIAMTLAIFENHPEATYEIEDEYRRAADLNQNGIIDMKDLVILSGMIADAKNK